MPIIDALLDHATAYPERTAFVCEGESLSYAGLTDTALALAHRLGAAAEGARPLMPGYGPQHVVALSLGNSADFVRAYAGAISSPMATAILDPTWPERQVTAALADLSPAVLITDSPQVAGLPEARHCRAVLVTGAAARTAPAADTVPDAHTALAPAAAVEPLTAWTESCSGTMRDETAATVLRDRSDDQLFLIGFTSGTTSDPKAFARTRRSWRASLPSSARLLRLGPGETTVAPGPLSHGLSLYGLTESLHAGGTFVSAHQFLPRACAHAIAEHGATRFIGVPTMLRALACTTDRPESLGGLRTLVSSGARLDRAVLDTLARTCPAAHVVEYYGASELSFVTLARTDLSAPLGARNGSATPVGRPFPGVEISVRRPTGEEADEGEPGTVHLRSELVCAGYLRPADGTGLRTDGTWHTVGDQGFLRAGTLHLLGREGDMLVSGGHNIHPAEIESALLEHPALTAAHVLGLPDRHLGTRPVAFLRRSETGALTSADLRTHLAARLPPHRLPGGFRTVDDWPLTTSGKIDPNRLLDRMEADDGRVRRLR